MAGSLRTVTPRECGLHPTAKPPLPFERRWDSARNRLPRWTRLHKGSPFRESFDYTRALTLICEDIACRSEALSHIDLTRVLVTVTPSRNRSRYGLQARMTPMRFREGALTRRYRGKLYGVQRYYLDGQEVLYLVTFCMPRFLDQSFENKLITIFHELYHISPNFDGDFRRHEGRYEIHSHSKREYDRHMQTLMERYLDGHPNSQMLDFLRYRTVDFMSSCGGLHGAIVPRPRLVPLLA